MRLTHEEQAWLDAYRQILAEQFPGLVQRIIIFGSKAKGTATPDSDLDVLVIIREGDWRLKDALAAPGYDLVIGTDVVPSILVYTEQEWEDRRRLRAPFWQAVDRDGVTVS
ncbi:MAG TPA: nucleotidyltransferase domain-containing protein [Candidatus Binatia bacterium]|jgi:predicted nucleotidyltransferase|nr:nucleotidyltransferase domain-containing protein [Candidatus Binatia bacterium]